MADENDESIKPKNPDVDESKNGDSQKVEDGTGPELDEDLAAALGDVSQADEDVDVNQLLSEIEPAFQNELDDISSKDFSGVLIEKESASTEVDDEEVVPSAFRSFLNNMPGETKTRYIAAIAVVATLIPFAILVYMGKILPRFEIPYVVSMQELSQKTFSYPVDDAEVPLFDEFRTKSHTVQFPKATINLKSVNGRVSYGEFEFSFVLRDKDLSSALEAKRSEILDLIMRVLEQVSWKELQSPIGKEKVKKILRHRVNEYLQGNVVLGVYYKSVILQK